jgi:hypothetical protein
MDQTKLHAKLIAVARQNPPSDHVPYAFEKRIMARLTQPVADAWSMWGTALWRSALACCTATLLLGAWSQLSTSSDSEDLSQAVDNTVYAAVDVSLDEDAQ